MLKHPCREEAIKLAKGQFLETLQTIQESNANHRRSRKRHRGDFPGSPVVKTSPSSAGDVGSIPGLGAKIYASWPKNQNTHTTEAIL